MHSGGSSSWWCVCTGEPDALHATVDGDCVYVGVSVTLYSNVFCVGLCIGVSVTLYANVDGDDVYVLVYLSPVR